MTGFRTFVQMLAVCGLISTAACNTVEGVGEDVRGAGQGINNAAERTHEDMNPNYKDRDPEDDRK